MTKPVSIRFQLVLVAVLAASGAALWIAREQVRDAVASLSKPVADLGSKRAKEGKGRKVPVIVALVDQGNNDEIVTAVGTARAQRSVMIFAKSDGIIVAFKPRAGDRVRRGGTIFQLDSTKTELDVQIAKNRLGEAGLLLERLEYLKKRNVGSRAKVDDAKTAYDRAQLELRKAERSLRDLTIEAPFDGVVGIPKAEVGDRVTATTPIIALDKRDKLFVEFEVPEKYLARIAIDDPITATTPSYERERFSGRIEHIDSRVDPTSRTVMVRAVTPNQTDQLRPGMSFAVELALSGKRFPAVPELALQWRRSESYIWIVQNGKVKKVLVETVKRLNSTILVAGELAPGDLVVIEGVQRLRPGTSVFYRPPDSTTSTPFRQPPQSARTDSRKKS